MSIRRILTATTAAAAIVLGGTLTAAPAQAASWSQLYSSKIACQAGTDKKLHQIRSQKPTYVHIRYTCKHVDGIWGSAIEWSTR